MRLILASFSPYILIRTSRKRGYFGDDGAVKRSSPFALR